MYELLVGNKTMYKGNEFYICKESEGKMYIYTWDKSIVDKSFIQVSGNISTNYQIMYKKYVNKDEIEEIYSFRKVFQYKGVKFLDVTQDCDGNYWIGSDDKKIAEALGLEAYIFDKYGYTIYHKLIKSNDKDLVMIGEDRRVTCL